MPRNPAGYIPHPAGKIEKDFTDTSSACGEIFHLLFSKCVTINIISYHFRGKKAGYM